MKISDNSKRLFSNTAFLYFMTISVQVLNFMTIPYLTRVLGPTFYGRIGLAQGYMVYVQTILDFGFMLSATQLISDNRDNKEFTSSVIASVSSIKLLMSVVIIFVFVGLSAFDFFDKTSAIIIFIYLMAYIINAMLPDYFYRGIEDMKVTSIRTVIIRIIFTLMIFSCVKSQNDYKLVPISFLIGSIIAVGFSFFDIRYRYKIKFSIPNYKSVFKLLKNSMPFFLSRFALTFYQALNVILIGKKYGAMPVVGYYTSSDKVITLARVASSPIADSLYPYMLRNKNFTLIKKILLFCMPIITAGCVVLFVFAEPFCIFVFGKEYADAGNVLRLLLPIAWIILPNYIISFPVMSPLGLVKYANISSIIGMIVQIVGLILLKLLNIYSVYSICALTSFTEIFVFLYRVLTVLFRNKILNKSR